MRKFIDLVSSAPYDFEDILLEAPRAYEEMIDATIRFFQNMPVDFDSNFTCNDYRNVAEEIKATAKWLGNNKNCATWFTRHYRAALMAVFERQLESSNVLAHVPENIARKITGYAHKIVADYTALVNNPAFPQRSINLFGIKQEVENFKAQIEHFRTVDYQPIRDFQFVDGMLPSTVLSRMTSMEQIFTERTNATSDRKIIPLEGDKIALKCADGFNWWLLDRASCVQEKGAMNHCGNTASPRQGQRILSLRQTVGKSEDGKPILVPYLTFIWNPDGTLGERKGRGNHKPAEAFYPYICDLFEQPWITGLVLGAHAVQMDVGLSDLPPEMQKKVVAANPKLVPIKDRIDQFGITPEIAAEIADGVKKIGPDFYTLRKFKLAELPQEQKDKLFEYQPELMSEEDYYKKNGLDEKMLDIINHGFKREGKHYINKLRYLTPEDKSALFDKHPEHMSEADYYRKHGMNGHMMETIAAAAKKESNPTRVLIDMGLANLVTDEDRAKLYQNYPETMPLLEWYERDGMSDAVMAFIAHGVAEKGPNWWYGRNFTLKNVPQEDRFKLWDAYPRLMSLDDRYERFGLDDTLVHLILTNLKEGDEEVRKFIKRLSAEDRDRLFEEHPETMDAPTYYERLGLTPVFKEIVEAGMKASGVKWFNDNFIWPCYWTSEETKQADRPKWVGLAYLNSEPCFLSREDTISIFEGDKRNFASCLPRLYYSVYGMDKTLKGYLRDHSENLNWADALGPRGQLPIDQIDRRHARALLQAHPELKLPSHYYQMHGLTPEFLKWIGTRDAQTNNDRYYGRANNEHQPQGMRWGIHPSSFDIREKLSKKDLETVFKTYPELMTYQEHYARRGLDKDLLKEIAEGWEKSGQGFFRSDFNPETDLKKKDLAELYRKKPEYMPFLRQIKVLPPKRAVKNMEAQIERLYDSSALSPSDSSLGTPIWDGKKKQFDIDWWTGVEEFVGVWGDDTIQHYAGEDPFDHWGDYDDDADQMDSVLPISMKLAIGKYAQKTYQSEPDEDDEDDFEGDEIDPKDWSQVKEVLDENDDAVIDALKSAASEGNRIGAESDAYDSVTSAILGINHQMAWGAFDLPLYKNAKDKERIQWDGKFTLYFTYDEMAKFLDTEVEGSDNQCNYDDKADFIKNKISVRSDNFYGFDDDAALDRFKDECPDEALEGVAENPFKGKYDHKINGRPWKKLSDTQMRTVIKDILGSEAGSMLSKYTYQGYEQQKGKELTKTFREVIEKVYG